MYSMVDNLSDFVNWLNFVMNEKGINQSDISRAGFVTRQAVSALFTFQIKSVGVDMCRAISMATGIPLEDVYRKAGLLPDNPGDPWADEQSRRLSQITDPALRSWAEKLIDTVIDQEKSNSAAKLKTKTAEK